MSLVPQTDAGSLMQGQPPACISGCTSTSAPQLATPLITARLQPQALLFTFLKL